jgi:hypothetical protein
MQPSPAALPGSPVRQPCPAALPGSLARQPCPAALPGSLARQPCPAALPVTALQKYYKFNKTKKFKNLSSVVHLLKKTACLKRVFVAWRAISKQILLRQ